MSGFIEFQGNHHAETFAFPIDFQWFYGFSELSGFIEFPVNRHAETLAFPIGFQWFPCHFCSESIEIHKILRGTPVIFAQNQ